MNQNQLRTNDGSVLVIDALNTNDCQFVSFRSHESILGELPTAEIVVRTDHDLVKPLDIVTISLKNSSGVSTEARLYVYSIEYLQNVYTIKLMGPDPDFIRKVKTNTFTSFKNAVSSLYPWEVDKNTDTDLLNDCQIYQMQETDYKLLTRLLHAYKKNTIFGYALSGLRIKDLNNYKNDFEEGGKLDSIINMNLLDPSSHTDPKLYKLDTEFIDYSDGVDPNHVLINFDRNLVPVNNEYQDLLANYIYNQRFATTLFSQNFSSRMLLPLNICDGVKINSEAEVDYRFVAARTINFDLNTIKVDYCIKSIKETTN